MEGGSYRAWGVCSPELMRNYGCCFESKDGLHWQRPSLGIFDYTGNRNNNLLYDAGWNRCVFADPIAPPAERYKMVVGDRGTVCGAVSADGLHWQEVGQILAGPADTLNVGCYDAELRKYVLYHRTLLPGDRRAIGRAESDNFRHFPSSQTVLEPTPDMPACTDLYTNGYTTIPGAPDLHLMFPTVYFRDRDLGEMAVASSLDGRLWQFLNAGASVLKPGEPGSWDAGWLTPTPSLIELSDGTFALPYIGCNLPHKYPRGHLKYGTGYALWPKGRIIAVQAAQQGHFTTNPIDTRGGRRLRVNAVVEPAGSIRIAVAGATGRGLDQCAPVAGDAYRHMVTWQGQDDLGFAAGSSVVLHVRMERARLFGLDFV
jgi:hypothetical protein